MPNVPSLPKPIDFKTYGGNEGIVFLTTKQYNFMISRMADDRHKVVLLTAKSVYFRNVVKGKLKKVDYLLERIEKSL